MEPREFRPEQKKELNQLSQSTNYYFITLLQCFNNIWIYKYVFRWSDILNVENAVIIKSNMLLYLQRNKYLLHRVI